MRTIPLLLHVRLYEAADFTNRNADDNDDDNDEDGSGGGGGSDDHKSIPRFMSQTHFHGPPSVSSFGIARITRATLVHG